MNLTRYIELLPEASRKGGLLFIDAETQCDLDIRKVGTPVYSTRAKPVCWAWAINDGPVNLWTPGQSLDWLTKHTGGFVAHNAEFESWILLHAYGMDVPPERWIDSAAVARYNNLPGKLEPLGEFLGFQKDMEGHKVMMKLCRPRKASKDNPDSYWTPETKPEDFQALYKYCVQDVEVSREALLFCEEPSVFEKRVMDETMHANAAGVAVDLENVARAIQLAEDDAKATSDRIKEITGCSATQVGPLADWCGMHSIAKHAVRDALKDPFIPEEQRQVLELRQAFAKTSTKKLKAMQLRSLHGRIHDAMIFGGAERTVRWTSPGVQLTNMPRGAGEKTGELFVRLERGLIEGDVQDTLKSMIRGFLTGPFFVGDYSQIEARTLAALAGNTRLLKIFADGGDPYRAMAAEIYHIKEAEVTSEQRFMGKQTILGCGYGLGEFGFQTMLDITYDVQIPSQESGRIVSIYRKNSPKEVALWGKVQRAVLHALRNPGKEFQLVPMVSVCAPRGWDELWIKLPSGRKLRYYDLELNGTELSAFGKMKNSPNYGRVNLYGGKFVGHITQSTARDILAYASVNLADHNYYSCLLVHDEAVVPAWGALSAFAKVFSQGPDWVAKLEIPLSADVFLCYRYRK